jgi:prepilin-type N-terminal cleavage/methylation domain-containing protein
LTHRPKNNTIKTKFSGAVGSSVNTLEIRMPLKEIAMPRNQQGFTLIEITVVLVLMAIISAYVIGRSFVPGQIDLAAQTDKIRNQIRYVQATAMKQSNEIWGIKCDTGTDQYWMFSATPPVEVGAPDLEENQVVFPGERDKKISLTGAGIDDISPGFTLFFDRIGKPYIAYADSTNNTPLAAPLIITVSAGSQSRSLRVVPETGLVQ